MVTYYDLFWNFCVPIKVPSSTYEKTQYLSQDLSAYNVLCTENEPNNWQVNLNCKSFAKNNIKMHIE